MGVQAVTKPGRGVKFPLDEAPIVLAEIVAYEAGVGFLIKPLHKDSPIVSCDVMQVPGANTGRYAVGDKVVVLCPDGGLRCVIAGRICIGQGTEESVGEPNETPDELILEARHTLTLRVGDGSITIKEDGRILIKGKDLVSQAKRRNRIRGGSVEIN